MYVRTYRYFGVPNRQTGLNKRTGWNISQKSINAQGLIIIILYCLFKSAQGGFFSKLIRTHSVFIRHARVCRLYF